MATKKLSIRDLTLRDGQQSLFATRMNQEQVDRVLPLYREAGFPYMEVWGGAVPDSVMRYLDENPWNRLETIRGAIGDQTKLTALSRGRNLFGYAPYPDSIIEGFANHAVQAGVSVMRVFDALNDLNNVRSSISAVNAAGGLSDGAVCYTVDPALGLKDRLANLTKGRWIPWQIFTIDYFVERARALQDMGVAMVTVKDMAGLLDPATCARLVPRLKKELKVPLDLHTHCTPGYGLATTIVALIHEIDVVDTAILPFSGGPAAPTYELVQIFADRLGLDTGIDRAVVGKLQNELRTIRRELADFDQTGILPIPFDISTDRLPKETEALVDRALEAARDGRFDDLLKATRAIEASFELPAPNEVVQRAQIPGGMYTNMLAQLKALNLEHLLPQVLTVVPHVRLDAGCPPLVTPTSQIVGVQAVNCVVDSSRGKPYYTTVSNQFRDLVKGVYGKTPIPISPTFREQITGSRDEVAYDISSWRPQEIPVLPDCGNVALTSSERDHLLLELFPSVARDFLHKLRREETKGQNPDSSSTASPPVDTDEEGWDELYLHMRS